MKNWFKNLRKTNKEKVSSTIIKWHEEDENKRACFTVLLDEVEGKTTGVLYGRHDKVVDALINEMMSVEDVRDLLLEVVANYAELTKPEEVVEEKPKRRRKKTDKVVS